MGVASRVEKRNDYGKGVSPYCSELCCMGEGNVTLFQCDNTGVVAAGVVAYYDISIKIEHMEAARPC